MHHVTTQMLGRRVYGLMKHWSTVCEQLPPGSDQFAKRWVAIDKIVVSNTLSKSTFQPAEPVSSRADSGGIRHMVAKTTVSQISGPPQLLKRFAQNG